ncbi:MAG: calcium-binding protein [Sandaracinaceae bacterium]
MNAALGTKAVWAMPLMLVWVLGRAGCVDATGFDSNDGGTATFSTLAHASAGRLPGVGASDDPCAQRPPATVRHGSSADEILRGGSHGDVIYGGPGDDTIYGGPGDDIIFGGPGDDVIYGGGGNDILCGEAGDDVIHGDRATATQLADNQGEDYIDAGPGRDVAWGNGGDDVIHGGTGGDELHGNEGDDELYGDLLDDTMFGEGGDDLLVGGHGIDRMYGGEGNDWLRGDTNRDVIQGGAGYDTASFMTATPPGQPLTQENIDDFLIGRDPETGELDPERATLPRELWGTAVALDPPFAAGLIAEGVVVVNQPTVNGVLTPFGRAVGDGSPEELRGIETIVGSAFADLIVAGPGTPFVFAELGDDTVITTGPTVVSGGGGNDTCTPLPCAPEEEPPARGSDVYVALATPERDPGLVVLGTTGDDHLDIWMDDGVVMVRSTDRRNITPGFGCRVGLSPWVVECAVGPVRLGWVMAYGDDGNDRISLEQGGFPHDLTATIDGGEGDDVLRGHDGQDILFTGGRVGRDELWGLEGDDALLSLGPGVLGGADADRMYGGPGHDQLVANYPCGGHSMHGGDGWDVGGFARVGTSFSDPTERCRQRIHARIGGRAYQPFFCPMGQGTDLANDIEVLEGAGGNDVLIGNGNDNTIWGWGGNDVLRGLSGDDVLESHDGDDWLFGGSGHDSLRGGHGFDRIHAADGEADKQIDCGADGGRIENADPSDPNGHACATAAWDGSEPWRDVCCPTDPSQERSEAWDRVCEASRLE